MDILKKIFPLTWKFKGDVKNLIIALVIYLIGGNVAAAILGITIILLPISGLVSLYGLVGAVLSILLFANVLKDEPAAEAEAKEEAPAEEAKDESAED